MPKDALIKLRCSTELKARITRLAKRRDQSVSDYIRARLIDTTPELRMYPESEDALLIAAESTPSDRKQDQAQLKAVEREEQKIVQRHLEAAQRKKDRAAHQALRGRKPTAQGSGG